MMFSLLLHLDRGTHCTRTSIGCRVDVSALPVLSAIAGYSVYKLYVPLACPVGVTCSSAAVFNPF